MPAGRALVLYARVPRRGAVKTRMTPPLTPDEALSLHVALLEDSHRLLKRAVALAGATHTVQFFFQIILCHVN